MRSEERWRCEVPLLCRLCLQHCGQNMRCTGVAECNGSRESGTGSSRKQVSEPEAQHDSMHCCRPSDEVPLILLWNLRYVGRYEDVECPAATGQLCHKQQPCTGRFQGN